LKKILILGAGGFAREACLHILDTVSNCDIAFYDDFPKSDNLKIKNKVFKIYKNFEFAQSEGFKEFIIGVGIPNTKILLTKKAFESGLQAHDTIVHPKAHIQDAQIGVGGIICPGVILTTNITIGDFVVLNLNTTIGHDAFIGDFSTCNPGASISGLCRLEESVYFGVGAATKEGISISEGVTIGGQAFVTKSITISGSTWVGVPAKELKH
jgi:sugar O-acyltransferase (sialic acid O-acetyltransferase NeuD family)